MITEKRIPLKYPLSMVKWDLLCTTLFASAIHYISKYYIDINLPLSIGAFMGTAIALILSFKLSQSYDRWWEARKIWGAIVNDSRTLINQLLTFTSENNDNAKTSAFAYRQIAWCYSLGQNLRKLDSLQGIEKYISKEEYSKIKHHKNIPLALLNNHSAELRKLHKDKHINDFQQIQLDNTIVRLIASMGMAERIKNTNFPKPYRLTLQFFIYLFLVILSFSLTELDSFIEIPILILISLPFFLLEKIALKIQDPFENRPMDTAMTSIARTIEINIKQLIDDEDIPEPLGTKKFYIM
ncbi:bestrophin family protein [Aquimarina latercula]|uniref:bestrophin family protein n=1 Tax=Aquimarina latercula TaxID=987 RepID=UPI00040C8EC2|nr:bestrophin family ion channel [Aquimarina latercula]